MAQRLYHALYNANDSSSVVTNTPPPPSTSLTPTATSFPSTMENLMQPIISTSPVLLSISPLAITFKVLFQPELQSQLSSLMSRIIQRAIYSRHSLPNRPLTMRSHWCLIMVEYRRKLHLSWCVASMAHA